MVEKGLDGKWYKPCSNCNTLQSYSRKGYAVQSLKLNKMCKACSNNITENCHRGFYNDIRLSWFTKMQNQSSLRGLKWDLTIEQLWDIYNSQNKKCALSGVDIGWNSKGQIHTVSIDRIDSSKGYVFNNIQLVHKDINFMKQQFEQEYFIDMCNKIATWRKQ